MQAMLVILLFSAVVVLRTMHARDTYVGRSGVLVRTIQAAVRWGGKTAGREGDGENDDQANGSSIGLGGRVAHCLWSLYDSLCSLLAVIAVVTAVVFVLLATLGYATFSVTDTVCQLVLTATNEMKEADAISEGDLSYFSTEGDNQCQLSTAMRGCGLLAAETCYKLPGLAWSLSFFLGVELPFDVDLTQPICVGVEGIAQSISSLCVAFYSAPKDELNAVVLPRLPNTHMLKVLPSFEAYTSWNSCDPPLPRGHRCSRSSTASGWSSREFTLSSRRCIHSSRASSSVVTAVRGALPLT